MLEVVLALLELVLELLELQLELLEVPEASGRPAASATAARAE